MDAGISRSARHSSGHATRHLVALVVMLALSGTVLAGGRSRREGHHAGELTGGARSVQGVPLRHAAAHGVGAQQGHQPGLVRAAGVDLRSGRRPERHARLLRRRRAGRRDAVAREHPDRHQGRHAARPRGGDRAARRIRPGHLDAQRQRRRPDRQSPVARPTDRVAGSRSTEHDNREAVPWTCPCDCPAVQAACGQICPHGAAAFTCAPFGGTCTASCSCK